MKSVYLIAYYTMKPRHQRVQTHIKGWMQDKENISYDERIAISKRLKDKDISMAGVILDMAQKKVIRNNYRPNSNFDDMFEYYYKNYNKYLDPIIKEMGYEMVDVNEPIVPQTVQTQTISSS